MRKKIPLIGGIINLIESLKGDIGIIENTDVATHSISAGSYVIWHNELYKASSAIAVDDALSSSNLTAVSGGAANELNNNIVQEIDTGTGTGTNALKAYKVGGKMIVLHTIGNGVSLTTSGYQLPEALAPKYSGVGCNAVRWANNQWQADAWVNIDSTGKLNIYFLSDKISTSYERFSVTYEANV